MNYWNAKKLMDTEGAKVRMTTWEEGCYLMIKKGLPIFVTKDGNEYRLKEVKNIMQGYLWKSWEVLK